ncbi:arylsulfatase [Blastococcus sp. SYSU D00695]
MEPPRPPAGAPNVLLIVLDDMGFGASSAFGGPCRMPVTDALAEGGLRFSRFHTAALCSPTRAALMTGRNHHSVGMGMVPELASNAPGYNGLRPRSAATIGQILLGNGYATSAFGKWHQTPPWHQTPAGPFDHWPTREGFDTFYGFLGGETDQFTPSLYSGTTPVDLPADPGYHLSEDLAARAIDWIDDVTRYTPGRPWFSYLSFGATHAPFQVPEAWRDRYRGEFGHGYHEQRHRTLARQKELGVVPPDTELSPWAPGVPDWDELTPAQRALSERLMEVYAAFAEHTDAQIGKVVDHLRATGQLDDTLIVYVLGDNGASAEGGLYGTLNEMVPFNGLPEDHERAAEDLDVIGTGDSYALYPVGWALSMDTPYQWTKQVASHYGGTRNGMIVHWPAAIADSGAIRHHWHHVIDVLPTVLEAAGLPQPAFVDGVAQGPLDGVSMLSAIRDAASPEARTTQYFEMLGNRGIYHRGWTAVTAHRVPWLTARAELNPLADDVWELYDTTTDWAQARDVAAEHPEELAELQALFRAEAERCGVFPIDDRMMERLGLDEGDRPGLALGRSVTYGPRTRRLREDAVPSVKNTSFSITAALRATARHSGVLASQGGRFAGWTLFVTDGRPAFAYNCMNQEITYVRSPRELVVGAENLVTVRFAYDGGGFGLGGDLTLELDGEPVATGRLEWSVPAYFSEDQTFNVGMDPESPVVRDYPQGLANAFDGEILSVTVTRGADGLDTDPEARLRVELGTQ